jgi:hypothetical protein
MNQKQLANVLIKVLGLWLCVESLTHIISSVISLLSTLLERGRGFGSGLYFWMNPLNGIAMGIAGVLFVLLSQSIADLLFKDE